MFRNLFLFICMIKFNMCIFINKRDRHDGRDGHDGHDGANYISTNKREKLNKTNIVPARAST